MERSGTGVQWVLFDVDGTLIDTWDLYIETFLRALEVHVGRRLTLEELAALHPTSYRAMRSCPRRTTRSWPTCGRCIPSSLPVCITA